MITNETLVESNITRISLHRKSKSVEIDFLSADGCSSRRIVANGVDEFQVAELRINHIVDDIFIYGPSDVDDEFFSTSLNNLLRGRECCDVDHFWPPFDAKYKAVARGDLTFWVINPVFGGAIYILARSVVISCEAIKG